MEDLASATDETLTRGIHGQDIDEPIQYREFVDRDSKPNPAQTQRNSHTKAGTKGHFEPHNEGHWVQGEEDVQYGRVDVDSPGVAQIYERVRTRASLNAPVPLKGNRCTLCNVPDHQAQDRRLRGNRQAPEQDRGAPPEIEDSLESADDGKLRNRADPWRNAVEDYIPP